jgi:hypothetical protein
MKDLTQMIRWNAGFVRGLAQSVLERAQVIRGTLKPVKAEPVAASAAKTAKISVKKAVKTAARKAKRPAPRKTKKV